jgi:hypothetical protein
MFLRTAVCVRARACVCVCNRPVTVWARESNV